MKPRKRTELGKHIVSDPEICGGKLTFKGTRILVDDVLYYVAKGKSWDWISMACDERINAEAIAEAVETARQSLSESQQRRRRAA